MVTYKNSGMQSFSLEALLAFSKPYHLSPDDWIAPWIIEKIKEREREKKNKYEQPRVYIEDDPMYMPQDEPEDEPGRGVVIIDIGRNDDSQSYDI